ncbi:ABC transporter permease [Extibacter muris]|uniref:ABC transporter permease n=1 Tax=Extibacter muris TaxID=1796622 RepID=UPI001D0980C3|nr:ABC transporter permease [Extibacter muris]MCB6202003.1 ABC transporter permease [Extibacter muris]MCQ4663324.1 ABC transporter permease [Extibacter muris]MCQ4692636.1 ABC transporter permease [Extibacter muris]
MVKTRRKVLESKYFYVVLSLLFMVVISSMLSQSFLTPGNLITILRQASILLMLSLGLTAVVITGNIDLSVGSLAALTGCVCAKMLVGGIPIAAAILASLAIGLIIGVLNGLLVGVLKLPSFVATYGMNMVASGLAMIVMNGGVIYGLPDKFTTIGIGYVGSIPIPIILSGVMAVVVYVLLQKTTFGRNIYMIGFNTQAANYSAVNCLGTLLAAYAFCGVTGSLGGIMLTARLNAADAGMSETYGIQIVAAVVMGGTSLLGGEGGVIGTVIGAIILTIIVNIMNIIGVNSNWQNFAVGIVIILMVWIDIYTRNRRARKLI